jgi:hypothetical protein
MNKCWIYNAERVNIFVHAYRYINIFLYTGINEIITNLQ